MKKIPVTAKLLAPVAIKRDRQSERSEGIHFISGTMVRGALSALYLQHYGEVNDTFKHLFLDDNSCRFGPLDPSLHCFPLTAAECKRKKIKHALLDQLWFRIAQHYWAGNVPDNTAETSWRQCDTCKADLKNLNGFWKKENGRLKEKSHERQVATHVGIDRHTTTAAESILYTLEALQPSNKEEDLYGWLMADEDALNSLKKLLQKEDCRISVGHHRTRGYGDLRLQLGNPVEKSDSQPRIEDWEQWNRDLIAFLSSPPFSVPDLNPSNDFYFGLSFPTRAVFVDRFLRYTLDPADLISYLPNMPSVDAAFPIQNRQPKPLASGGTMYWIATVTQHERLRGWNAAHGLPRQDEWAVARGAVYVYRFTGTPTEREALFAQLATLCEEGVGLRRNEGFGTVIVSDNFHRKFCKQEVQS